MDPMMGDDNIVEGWLRSLNLVHYTQSFIDNGYDDLEICKQIGDPDLDAIGVEKDSHREEILKAVKVLREQGGTHVYFILENPDYQEQNGVSADYFHDRELPAIPVEENKSPKIVNDTIVPNKPPIPPPLQPPGAKKGIELLRDGDKSYVVYPKLQLTSIVRDKLQEDGINLLHEPYSKKDHNPCIEELQSLAASYSSQLKVRSGDVLERLEELHAWNLALESSQSSPEGEAGADGASSPGQQYTMYSIYGQSARSVQPPTRHTALSGGYTDPVELEVGGVAGKHVSPSKSMHSAEGDSEISTSSQNISGSTTSTPERIIQAGTNTISRFLKGVTARRSGRKYTYKKPVQDDLSASEITMSDDDRIQLMIMVKEGKLSMHEAVEAVKQYEVQHRRELHALHGGQSTVCSMCREVLDSPAISRKAKVAYAKANLCQTQSKVVKNGQNWKLGLAKSKSNSPMSLLKHRSPRRNKEDDREYSDPGCIEYTAEELRLQELTSSHSSPCTSLNQSPELARRAYEGLNRAQLFESAGQQFYSPIHAGVRKKVVDSTPAKTPKFFSSPSKSKENIPLDSGLKSPKEKKRTFSSPFNRRKSDIKSSKKSVDSLKSSQATERVLSPLAFTRQSSDTGSTSSGGIHSPISRLLHSPATLDSDFVGSVVHSPSGELRRIDVRKQREKGASSPTLSRSRHPSSPARVDCCGHQSRRRSSDSYASHSQRSVSFTTFKRSPSHDPQILRTTSKSPAGYPQDAPYRIHRAITQPISENYDYAYVCHIDRVVGSTTAVIEPLPADYEPLHRSRSLDQARPQRSRSLEHAAAGSRVCLVDIEDSRSPKRHKSPGSSPPEALSPKRQYLSNELPIDVADISKGHACNVATTTQIVIEDRCNADSSKSHSSPIKKEGKLDSPELLGSIDTSPTGTLDSAGESKYGSSSTMSVGSEASPTTDRRPPRHAAAAGGTGREKATLHAARPRSSSFTTGGEECFSSEEDFELRSDENFSRNAAIRSSLSEKVKVIHRDMKKKIARLRKNDEEAVAQQGGDVMVSTDEVTLEEGETSGSRDTMHSLSAFHQLASSSSSQSSMSVDEADPAYRGPVLARARVTADYTPSPYDKDALALKKGEIVHIISMSETGMWKGFVHNRIGHFKFIHVEILASGGGSDQATAGVPNGVAPLGTSGRARGRERGRQTGTGRRTRPRTVEELLTRLGLQGLLRLFLLHGYDSLALFAQLEAADLDELGITQPEDRAKILTAAQLLDPNEADNPAAADYACDDSPARSEAGLSVSCPSPATSLCDSPHTPSTAGGGGGAVSKDSGCSSGESTLKQDKCKDTPEKEWINHLPAESDMSTSLLSSSSTLTRPLSGSTQDDPQHRTTVIPDTVHGGQHQQQQPLVDYSQEEDQEIISITSNGEIKIERQDGVRYTTPSLSKKCCSSSCSQQAEGAQQKTHDRKSSSKRHLCDKHRAEIAQRQSASDSSRISSSSSSSSVIVEREAEAHSAEDMVRSQQVSPRTSSSSPGRRSHSLKERSPSKSSGHHHHHHQHHHHHHCTSSSSSSHKHSRGPKIPDRSTSMGHTSPSGGCQKDASTQHSAARGRIVQAKRRSRSPNAVDLISAVSPAASPKVKTATVRQLSSPAARMLAAAAAGSSPPTSRPSSSSLEHLVALKLHEEGIDLAHEPYSDKTGHCGIPAALILRYSEELRRDQYEVALALDDTRVRLLQSKHMPWVPNDFHSTTYQTSLPAGASTHILEFLTVLGLPMYVPAFKQKGFKTVTSLQMLREEDMQGLGVHDQKHCKRILDAVKVLAEGDWKYNLPTAIVSQRLHAKHSKVTDKV